MNSTPQVQDYKTHRRYVPGYHYVAGILLSINLLYALYVLVTDFSVASAVAVGTAVALFFVGFYARAFALKAQDRVIRLEERQRLHQLLQDDLRPSIPTLSVEQLVSLRFASDPELPGLVRKVLAEGITDGEEIKKLIKDWRPDLDRV